MSRGRSSGGVYSHVRQHDGLEEPTTAAPFGTMSYNVYGDGYLQLARPAGANWQHTSSGYKPAMLVHNCEHPSLINRAQEIYIGGTTARTGTLLADNSSATNIPADPNDTISTYHGQSVNASTALNRYYMGAADDSIARYTCCILRVGSPFRILKMGVYLVDATSVTTMRGKFGIYRAANHYNDNAMPWKIYDNALLYLDESSPISGYKYTLNWYSYSESPIIEDEKFYVKAHWSNTTSGGSGPGLLVRYGLDMAQGFKGDRSNTSDGTYASPVWTTVHNYTAAVGSQDSALGKSSVLYWFMVEPL
jgi:hypothetical protein